jgi:DNA repair protein SbcD/Mre11
LLVHTGLLECSQGEAYVILVTSTEEAVTGVANASRLRVLHTADLHLDRSFASWGDAAPVRRRDLLDTLDEIGELARANHVQLVLLSGDQFDRHNPGPNTVARFQGWLDRLNRDGIRAALICGNHDSYWYENSIYRQQLCPNVIAFPAPTCEAPVELLVNGIRVSLYGIAHDHTQHRDVITGFRRRSEEGVHIGLLHCTVDAPDEFDVADRYLPLTSDTLRETGLDYIALGHLHRARTLNAGGPGMAAYPGSPEPLDLSETGPRSVALLTFNGDSPELTTLPCGKRTARREAIDCTNLDNEGIAQRIRAFAGDGTILSAVLTGAPRDLPDPVSLQQRLIGDFCYLSISDGTSVVDTGFVRTIENEATIRGHFVRQLRERVAAAETERDREMAELALRVGLIRLAQRSAR